MCWEINVFAFSAAGEYVENQGEDTGQSNACELLCPVFSHGTGTAIKKLTDKVLAGIKQIEDMLIFRFIFTIRTK